MGSALEGDIESALGPFAFHCFPTQKRLHNAITITSTLHAVLDTPMQLPKAYAIYLFATRVIAHALDYDVCVLHPDTFSVYADPLTEALHTLVGKMLHQHKSQKYPKSNSHYPDPVQGATLSTPHG